MSARSHVHAPASRIPHEDGGLHRAHTLRSAGRSGVYDL